MAKCVNSLTLWEASEKQAEAGALALHLRDCAGCRAEALAEAPELLFALLGGREVPVEALPRTAVSPWTGVLRRAAAALLVLGLGWLGQALWREGALVAPEGGAVRSVSTAPAGPSVEELRAAYPLVRMAEGQADMSLPLYQGVLPDGTRMVFFDAAIR